MTLLEDILFGISIVAFVGGTIATVTAIVTTPVWFIIALLFPFVPSLRPLWSFWTLLMLGQFSLIASLALLILLNPSVSHSDPWAEPPVRSLWVIPLLAAGLTWLSWRRGRKADAEQEQRSLSLALQLITIGLVVLFAVTMSHQR